MFVAPPFPRYVINYWQSNVPNTLQYLKIHVIVRVLGLLMPKHPLHPWKSICEVPPWGAFMETLCAVCFGLYASVFSASRPFLLVINENTLGASCRIPMRVDTVASNSL